MTLADYDIAGAPDLTLAAFAGPLDTWDSPALSEAGAMYRALVDAGVRPSVFLAFFWVESKFGTTGIVKLFDTKNPGNVRTPEITSALTTIVDTPRGKFARYPTWESGARDWAARMVGPKYAGVGLRTVRQVLPKYAPSADSNDPDAYARAVLARVEEWTKGAPPVTLQKPPVMSNPSPNHGYPGDYKPETVVWHITAGSGASALSWLTNPASNASANYVITEDGKVHELVNPEAGQQGAAWANGQVDKPNMANPLVRSWIDAGINPNRRSVSIEHAGQSSMGKGGSLTKAQIAATIRLTAWLCGRFGIVPDRAHIIPHAFIDSVNRANCPGFSEIEWVTWVDAINEIVKSGTAPPPMPFQHAPGWLDPLVDTFDWQGAGIVTYRKVRAWNDQEKRMYEREWSAQGGYTPWVVVQ